MVAVSRFLPNFAIFAVVAASGAVAAIADDAFQNRVLPILEQNCFDCHEPGLSKGDVPFLEAQKPADIDAMRSVWRSVAAQLRNQTMPPPDKPQPSDEDRKFAANWIDGYLRESAARMPPFAGQVMARRLNRLEFDRTIRGLFGVDLKFSETLPADSGTGEGFDNNGESLFLPPMLLERYLEAAQQIVDAAIVSSRLTRKFPGDETVLAPIYVESGYRIALEGEVSGKPGKARLLVDGLPVHEFQPAPKNGRFRQNLDVKLARGVHAIRVEGELRVTSLMVRQFEPEKPSAEQLANHERLIGAVPGIVPADPNKLAKEMLGEFLPLAFRRPVSDDELKPFLTLVKRGLDRGDPYEEAMKLALRGIIVSPDFLFRLEKSPAKPGIQPLTGHELATRLSYFLWSTMPDERLRGLAGAGKLNDKASLTNEVRRMLADERAGAFFRAFIGQWLGTKDVGGRVAPTANDVQEFYTPQIAADMRQEAVEYFAHLVRENRSILELIDSDYTILTGRLAKFYELPNAGKLKKDAFQVVRNPGQQRGGVLGMGAVLALTSHHKKTSPVLRGAWVFDTLLGSPVPPPPPDVPPLPEVEVDAKTGKKRKLNSREKLQKHREHTSCMACHRLIDPIGFGLQKFDWVGRWRDRENGKPVNSSGVLPSGETFEGPAELKRVLVETRRDEFVRNLTRKLLGYALGRGLEDRDDGTIEQIAGKLEAEGFGARVLIEEIVLSVPFGNQQGTSG